jgi:hypothetical protein
MFLRSAPFWAGIIALGWITAIVLFQVADAIDVSCRSATPANGFRGVPPAGDGEAASTVVIPLSTAGGGTS